MRDPILLADDSYFVNSELPPTFILDIYNIVNKINRVKDIINDNKSKIQKFNDEKHSNEKVDSIVKADGKHENRPESSLSDWYQIIITFINVLPTITRTKQCI